MKIIRLNNSILSLTGTLVSLVSKSMKKNKKREVSSFTNKLEVRTWKANFLISSVAIKPNSLV